MTYRPTVTSREYPTMPVLDLADLRKVLPQGKRLLGLDVGTKTIGLALSDPSLAVASPIETLRRTKFTKDAESLLALMHGHEVGGLVVGLPVNMNGSEGPRCQSSRQFARNLLEKQDVPLAFWDERLSTAAIQRFLTDDADLSRRRRGELVDKLAAAYILQGALDALAG